MGLSISGLAIYALTSNSTSEYLTHLTGGFWTSSVLFYEYHSKGRVVTASYDQDSLVTKLLPLIELYDDQVESVRHYKSKLLMQTILFYHDFLVIKTPKWYYSLEKNSSGIILQRSRHLEDVVTRGQNNPRDIDPDNYEELNLTGRFIFRRIIQWILLTGELKISRLSTGNQFQANQRLMNNNNRGPERMGVFWSAAAVPLLYPLAGGSWSSCLFFYEYLPDGRVILGEYKEGAIKTQLLPLLGSSESVESLTVYKSRLLFTTSTQMSVHHAFLVAKTPNWYYSLEKNMLGLVLQRSIRREDVLGRIENVSRKVDPLTEGETLSFSGQLPFGRIIEWIQLSGELDKGYSFFGNNCQLFVGNFKEAFVL